MKMIRIILLSFTSSAFAQSGISTVPQALQSPQNSQAIPQNTEIADPTSSPSAPSATTPRIIIPVGDPSVKKVLLAIEPTIGADGVAQEFFQTMNSDMDFSDMFELLPLTRLPERKGYLNGYKILGVEFLIQSEVQKNVAGKFEATVRLWDVNKGMVLLARRYPFVSSSGQVGRELAHFSANDIVQTLTGEPGIFRTRILLSCGKKNIRELYIMDFDGQNVRQLTHDRNMVLSPSWAQDGKRILFTAYRASKPKAFVNPNLYLMDLVSNKTQSISREQGLNSGGVFRPGHNQIAFVFSKKGRPELFLRDLTANTIMKLTESQSSYFTVEPSWNPNGTQLAYSSHAYAKKDESHPHIYIANANGANRKRLTFAGTYNSSPNWSPKGDKIAFSGQENRANNFNIFTVNPNSGEIQRLTDGSDSKENPSFSPDGRFIAFSGNSGGSYRIYVMTAGGTRIRALTNPALGSCKQPAWSPRL